MRIHYNVTGATRKALVIAISQALNAPIRYLGMPTAAFEVGNYTIDKNGVVSGPDNLELEDALFQKGYEAKEREYDEPDTYESGLGGLGATPPIEDLEIETVPWAVREIVIEIPKNGMMDAQVQNILNLIESKRALLAKALGRPLTVNATEETLQFQYPYSEENGVGIIYSQLTTALVNHVKKHQRVLSEERQIKSEKFAMRTFLVRLGMNGQEYSATRKWLCRKLSGNASFSNDSSYVALKSGRRIGGQTGEQ